MADELTDQQERLIQLAWDRIQEALLTNKVEIQGKPGVEGRTHIFSPSEYARLLQWVAGYQQKGRKKLDLPMLRDNFILPSSGTE